jgi:hypothetical protein
MKLTVAEILILVDTLRGSVRIADNARIFGYTSETRAELLEILHNRLKEVEINLEKEKAE